MTFPRVFLALLLPIALSAQTSKTVRFGDAMTCGIVKLAGDKVQAYCYQRNALVFNATYTLAPSVVVNYHFADNWITWVVRKSPDPAVIDYEYSLEASGPVLTGSLK